MPHPTSPPTVDREALPWRPCAGIVLVNDAGLVFSGRRIDGGETRGNMWQLPQGGIDEGEDPVDACFREMEEEIGTRAASLLAVTKDWLTYDLPDELLGKVWKGRYRGQKQKWFALRFEGIDADINIETEHPEFSEWAWRRAEELILETVPFKRDVYRQVFTEFAEYLT